MINKKNKLRQTLQRELAEIEKREVQIGKTAERSALSVMMKRIEGKIPDKVYKGLESVFIKAFTSVFEQGRTLIEKTYNREKILDDHSIMNYALEVKGRPRELKRMKFKARKGDLINFSVTALEGVALGALGIGLPDIVLFISTLFKGIYETALNYGYDYVNQKDQLIILKMMTVPLLRGDDRAKADSELEAMFSGDTPLLSDEQFYGCLRECASLYAMDMLLLKFVQGIPIVGIFAGAVNPVYYKKIIGYAQLKYQKMFILKKLEALE